MSSSMSNASSNLGVLSASDTEPEINLSSGSQSDTDFEVVLVTRAIDSSVVSDSDSASLVSAPSDLDESSDDEHIFVQHIQSAPNTPRPPAVVPPRLEATPRPPVAIARPVIEDDSDSASDREDDLSTDYDSDSDADGSVVVHARARTVTATHSRLEALHSALGTAHSNGSTATIRPARPTPANTIRRSAPAGMHTPAITTNTIVRIVASVPLSPPTPSDDGDIPYDPFTAAPTAVAVPVPMAIIPVPALATPRLHTPVPSIPTARNITRKMWTTMNTARMRLGLWPLKHSYREQLNLERRQATANPLVAPPPTAGRSPVSSEDEAPRQRVSMFSPVNDMSVHNDSPDEEAYDDAIRQLDEHMTSPPEHPTAAYRYLLNRALLLEFRVCTPETLPTSHGAAIAMVKANVHINVLDYVAKRKEGFSGLRSVMLANAKTLRKDVKKRRMPAKTVKSLGLHSLLIHH